jgi:CrcB protein
MLEHPPLRIAIAISLGAIAGALSRYYLILWFVQRLGSSFPYGTLFINVTGCLVMGFFSTLVLESVTTLGPEIRIMVTVGFLGSYTTFSTYGLDTIALLRNGRSELAGLYWTGSAILGVLAVEFGIRLARFLK